MTLSHLQESMDNLKDLFMSMMTSVREQLFDVKFALAQGDKDLAEIVDQRENAINRKELLIDKECEKILALYGPVAIDLRLVLSIIEMNTHLERLGDLAQMIAEGVINLSAKKLKSYSAELHIDEYCEKVVESFDMAIFCFENENIQNIPEILIKNRHVKKQVKESLNDFVKLLKEKPNDAESLLILYSISRAILRMLDMIDNIVEEIVFYIEAHVIKHKKKKHKKLARHIKSKELEKDASASNEDTSVSG